MNRSAKSGVMVVRPLEAGPDGRLCGLAVRPRPEDPVDAATYDRPVPGMLTLRVVRPDEFTE